eukprot:TRINITY_DN912_c0_g1_i2.p1 TRINITY_DN912_c0_g1~~TRINITY_DN912_c0_g1_i2.p1  ORF type:complete len:276 (-),score=117.01 TRINITY_DN912_c0_g1_i2:411-1196(-)
MVKEVDKVDSVPEVAESSVKAEDKVEEEKEGKEDKMEDSPPVETIKSEDVATAKEVAKVDPITEVDENLVKAEENVEEEKAEKIDKIEESPPPETTKLEDFAGSDFATSVAECSSGVEKASKDAEIVVSEILKEDIPTSSDASKDRDVGGIDVIDTKEQGLEEKAEEQPIQSGGDNVEKAEEKTEEAEKSDLQNPVEPTKDSDPKVDRDIAKQEVPAKQKHSNNLISKVKHSIGKVKKAIIGKSPSSKTLSSETKGDTNVK